MQTMRNCKTFQKSQICNNYSNFARGEREQRKRKIPQKLFFLLKCKSRGGYAFIEQEKLISKKHNLTNVLQSKWPYMYLRKM